MVDRYKQIHMKFDKIWEFHVKRPLKQAKILKAVNFISKNLHFQSKSILMRKIDKIVTCHMGTTKVCNLIKTNFNS